MTRTKWPDDSWSSHHFPLMLREPQNVSCHLPCSVPSHQKSAQGYSCRVQKSKQDNSITYHWQFVCCCWRDSQYFEISSPCILCTKVKLQLLRFRALQATEGVVEWFRLRQSVQQNWNENKFSKCPKNMGGSITTALSEWGHKHP